MKIYKEMSKSLSRKILLPLCILGVTLIIVICLLIPYLFQTVTSEHIKNEVTQAAIAVGKVNAYGFDPERTQWIVQMMADQGQFDLIVVTEGQDLRVIASTRPEWIGLRAEDLPDAGVVKNFNQSGHIELCDMNRVFIENTVIENGKLLNVLIYKNLKLKYINNIYTKFATVFIFCISILLFLFIYIIYYEINKFFLQPLQKIVQYIHKQEDQIEIESVDLVQFADDEIGLLIKTLNAYQNRLQEKHVQMTMLYQERVQVEKALRANEAFLRDGERIARLGSWQLDLETNDLTFTPGTLHVLEHDAAQALSLEDVWRMVAPDHQGPMMVAILKGMETGEPQTGRVMLYTPSGRELWIEYKMIPDSEQPGQFISGAIQDITDRVEFERQLEVSRKELEDAQSIAHMGSWKINCNNGQCVWSAEMYRLLALDSRKILPSIGLMESCIYVEDLALFQEILNWKNSIEPIELEHRLYLPNGQIKWVMTRCIHEINSNGELYTSGTLQDISLLKRARETERLAKEKEDAEAANRTKGKFIANISHEIRTPLHAIIGFTHLSIDRATEPQVIEYLQKIEKAGKHLLSIVNDILDMSKIDAGGMLLEQIPFSLHETIHEAIHILEDRAVEKGLMLVWMADERIPDHLTGDPLRLMQIVMNLLGNAIKFSERGSITVRTTLIGQYEDRVQVRIDVEDYGIGLSEEQHQRLFKDFSQADDSTSRKYGGTGLGLSIVSRLCTLMGGTVEVQSTLGQGSTFSVELSLAIATAPVIFQQEDDIQNPARVIAAEYAGVPILLVEDDPVNEELARDLMRVTALRVESAVNGAIAVERIKQSNFALVLMDLQMPVMGGLDATRLIRLLPGQAALPIIAMTANAFQEDRDRCILAGMSEHLRKPIEPERLYEVLLSCLRTRHDFIRSFSTPPLNVSPGITIPPHVTVPPHVTMLRIAAQADPGPHGGEPSEQPSVPDIPGIDTVIGLRSVGNRPANYMRMLSIFADTHRGDIPAMRTSLLSGDLQTAQRIAHTLRGLAGSIGARQVEQQVAALEVAMREQPVEGVLRALNQLADVFVPLLSEIQSRVSSAQNAEADMPENLDQAALREAVRELKQMLREDDARTRRIWDHAVPMFRKAWGVRVDTIERHIMNFSYDQALELISIINSEEDG